jgi:hypothetical protein
MRCGTSGASGHVTTKLCVLPREVSHVHRLWVVLRGEQSTLTAWEKSAEGIVGDCRGG